jgi:hypothetical protein
MGGLVSRRYLQIFGHNDIAGLILIGTPNKGIVGKTAEFCPFIGNSFECKEMQEDSLFMNKLNRDPLPPIPMHAIIGVGCPMENGPGDGVVTAANAQLDWAVNHVVTGRCTTLETFHTEMLNIERYPDVYDIIKEALDQMSSLRDSRS